LCSRASQIGERKSKSASERFEICFRRRGNRGACRHAHTVPRFSAGASFKHSDVVHFHAPAEHLSRTECSGVLRISTEKAFRVVDFKRSLRACPPTPRSKVFRRSSLSEDRPELAADVDVERPASAARESARDVDAHEIERQKIRDAQRRIETILRS